MHNLTHLPMLALAVMAMPAVAVAQDGTLVLTIAGEAYDGDPRFAVSFAGKELGEGVIDTAIDTANVGRFANADKPADYVGEFRFAIPEAAYKSGGEIRVSFLNEAYGGPGSNRDRNLFIASATVNGVDFPAAAFVTRSSAGLQPNAMLGAYLVINDGSADAILAAPPAGWPDPGVEQAAAQPVKPPELPPTPATPVPATPELAASPESAAPALSAPSPLPAPIRAAATAEIELASLDTSALDGSQCRKAERYNVVGFRENSNAITPRVIDRLDQILADIGGQKCVIQVIGYSDTRGSYATNALFAVERAQNVVAYLRDKGLPYLDINATGAGETTRFGPSPAPNRRVVITVRP
jgi:outer membrane protein OmpA-like peptidoglycan-associated protein